VATESRPVRAQGIPVFDIRAIAQVTQIATKTLTTLERLKEQYDTIVRMGKGLQGSLERYRIPTIPIVGHDTSQYPYGRPWLQGMNSGDARGAGYFETVQRLQLPTGLIELLPADAQSAIKTAYATIEILDSVATMGAHQAALVRGYDTRIQAAIESLAGDILNPRADFHEMTAVTDKIANAQLIARRQDMATNQLLSHTVEQLLARNKRTRDDEAANMNMRLDGLRDGKRVGESVIQGAAESLRSWRMP
jgi:hypothetical protein